MWWGVLKSGSPCCIGTTPGPGGAVAPARSEVISRLIAAEGSRTVILRPVGTGACRPPLDEWVGEAAAELCRSGRQGRNDRTASRPAAQCSGPRVRSGIGESDRHFLTPPDPSLWPTNPIW